MFRKILLVGLLVLVSRVVTVSAAAWENKPKPDSTTLIYLSLDENSGTKAADASGNHNDGTLCNGAKWVPGKFGSAVAFDGVGSYITTLEKLNSLEQFTAECWVKVGKLPEKDDVRIINAPGTFWTISVTPDGVFNGLAWDGDNRLIRGKEKIVLDQWYHVALTYQGAKREVKLYVNGKLDGALTYEGGTGAVPPGKVQIGAAYDGTGGQFTGVVDEVLISETVKKF